MVRDRERPYHHGDLKRALLDASLELLREEGLEALTVAEIGRRVGVSSAAPYKHFADRQALLRALAEEGNHRLNDAIRRAVEEVEDPREAFRLSGIEYVRFAAENPHLFRLMTDPSLLDYANPPEGLQAPGALEGRMETFWVDLAALIRKGEEVPADHPLLLQLRGRALAHGLAGFFVSGIFGALGISADEAERIARAVTGEDLPRRAPRKKSRRAGGGPAKREAARASSRGSPSARPTRTRSAGERKPV